MSRLQFDVCKYIFRKENHFFQNSFVLHNFYNTYRAKLRASPDFNVMLFAKQGVCIVIMYEKNYLKCRL